MMADETTKDMNGSRSFEERVFGRFDALQASFTGLEVRFTGFEARFTGLEASVKNLDGRLEKLEIKAFDTKRIWEQALKEIVETRRELSKRLDRIEAIVHETRADLRDAEDRIERLESKPT